MKQETVTGRFRLCFNCNGQPDERLSELERPTPKAFTAPEPIRAGERFCC